VVAGGLNLVNQSELRHPYSFHNVQCQNDIEVEPASDLQDATDKLRFVQRGFYAKQALASEDGYKQARESYLLTHDPRLTTRK
jgi:hypothetical protein